MAAFKKYASTSRCRIVRHPPLAAVGITHANSVIAVVRFSDGELATTTTSFVPSKLSAPPNRPCGLHVAPEITPVLLFPDASAVVGPAPSLNPHAATSPGMDCANAPVGIMATSATTRNTRNRTVPWFRVVARIITAPYSGYRADRAKAMRSLLRRDQRGGSGMRRATSVFDAIAHRRESEGHRNKVG